MRVELFDFDLPQERIAVRPASPRDSARLLAVRPQRGELEDRIMRDLPQLLRAGDLLVFNDTKVIPARLTGKRGLAKMEVTLHKQEAADIWKVFAKPARRLRKGDRVTFAEDFYAEVLEQGEEGERLLRFNRGGAALMQALMAHGHMPLPPYIARKEGADARDASDYQTLFARHEGAVAAPTAGLHFTPDLMTRLEAAGIRHAFVTLHVGAGTFLPVKAEDTSGHKMHSEWGEVSAATAEAINVTRAKGGRVVAVGTTSLRLLESAAHADGAMQPFSAETDIFITPGYRFKVVDLLLTNFHLPRSTLFMLVSAFSGLENMHRAYAHAIAGGYRFYSYGDGCLLEKASAINAGPRLHE